MHVAFVYPNPRRELVAEVAAGTSPDTTLLGQNHLAEHGIEAVVHDSVVRRRGSRPTALDRVRWHLREVTLPWELEAADIVVTPLHKLLPLTARLRRHQRVVVLYYGIPAGSWLAMSAPYRSVLRASLRSAAAVVAISEACRRQLVERLGVRPERVSVQRLGVDERWWSPQPAARVRPEPTPAVRPERSTDVRPERNTEVGTGRSTEVGTGRTSGSRTVLTVGRDLARDYETFARALEGTDLHGVIAAKPENLRGVRVPANVEVKLDVLLAGVRALVQDAACVVVPMVDERDARGSEGSGTTAILEAMASARATVSTEREHLEEYLLRDESTLVVPPRDPAALRAAVLSLVDDPARAAALGGAGRAFVEGQLTTRHLAAGLVPVIRGVVS